MNARRLAAALSLLVVSGCFSMTVPAPAIHEYRLDYPPPPIDRTPIGVVVRVGTFGIAAVYDRQAIVYRDGRYATGTYYYDRWMANPANMIVDLLGRDLAASGLYRAVQQGPSPVPSDFELSGQIEEIEEQRTARSCAAHLRLRILLEKMTGPREDRVALERTYTGNQPCEAGAPQPFVAAMSAALEQVSTGIQQDVYTAIHDATAAD